MSILTDYLTGVYQQTIFFDYDCNRPILDNSVFNASFTEQEIKEAIGNLKSGKAAAMDRVLNKYIKSMHFYAPICLFFKQDFEL